MIIKNDSKIKELNVLGNPIIVECKNWTKPVGSKDVNWFVSKVKKRGLSTGILISFEGITGDQHKDAKNEIIRALEQGIKIIVLDKVDLKSFYAPRDFSTKLEEKYYSLFAL